MRITTESRLKEFGKKHGCESVILELIKKLRVITPANLVELQKTFPSAENIEHKYTVINFGGNNYRLISSIHYKSNRIFIREVLTHDEYSKNKWKR